MFKPKVYLLASLLSLLCTSIFAADGCCSGMGGVSYCDSSAGRLVCKNGFYSACYCTRHSVMDLQLLVGCCLWHGGVLPIVDGTGSVRCRDGFISEECSLQNPVETIAAW
ncbi:MAG: neurogenic locus notch [Legionella sp.]|jgi:hypothetical protein